MDGGEFSYRGAAEDGDALVMTLTEDFTVRGGGHAYVNKMTLTAAEILVDKEGLIEANSQGFPPGSGDGVGRSPFGGFGGSGRDDGFDLA